MHILRWDQKLSSDDTNRVLLHLASWHSAQISQSGAEAYSDLLDAVRTENVKALCLYDFRPLGSNAADLYHAYQISAFFSKRKDIDIGVGTATVAWKTFVEAEDKCRESNQLFRAYFRGGFNFSPRVEAVFFAAQRKIARILGDLPELSDLHLRFGPGATTSVKKKDASARRKLSSVFACSKEATGLLPEILAEMPGWCGLEIGTTADGVTVPTQVHPGKVGFVPKNAKTDRTINVEPMLNSMVQLGIGEYIATQLRGIGIDIRDQSLNQRLAREGSLTGALATLDLKSASGLISKGFVESFLPVDWWLFLSKIRTGFCLTPDGGHELEQFSSMGNGFTFPLQTLIFYALAKACEEMTVEVKDRRVTVYGDDIICPTEVVPLVVEVLTASGFWLNQRKSYWLGPFRESCGKDYLSGIDVRPCFIKGPLLGSDVFRLHNFYVRHELPEPANHLLGLIDPSIRLFGPDGYGDGHLLGGWTGTAIKRDDGWCGVTFETFTWKAKRAFYRLGADYVYPSYSVYLREKEPDIADDQAVMALSKLRRRRSHGRISSDRADASYVKQNGKVFLADTLPGTAGYKRIKIYTFCQEPEAT